MNISHDYVNIEVLMDFDLDMHGMTSLGWEHLNSAGDISHCYVTFDIMYHLAVGKFDISSWIFQIDHVNVNLIVHFDINMWKPEWIGEVDAMVHISRWEIELHMWNS